MSEPQKSLPAGVLWSRRAGHLLGALLLLLGLLAFGRGTAGFETVKAVYCLAYGALLLVPASRIARERIWRLFFGLLLIASAGFVFLLVASVMFDYMAAAERGERLGVPGFEGALIFLALLQVPAAVFERRPDLID